MINIQNSVSYCKFRHIQAYCGIFRTLCNSCIFRTCHIQNSGIFRTQDIFSTLSRHILEYSEHCVCNARIMRTLPHSELCHIQNLAYLGPEAYSNSGLYRHIKAYSIIIVLITLTFFFYFNLHTFARNLKRHVSWLQ